MAFPRTPYTKWALLTFGGGLVLGLAVVSLDVPEIGWTASLAMAGSLLLLPAALVADWWSHRPWKAPAKRRATRSRARPPAKPKPPPKRRGKGG